VPTQTNKTPQELIVLPDPEAVSQAAAERFATAAQTYDPFTVALSGGSTPRRLYEMLTTPRFRDQIPWEHVHVFWGDERCVPPAHRESNYGMAREALLDHVPLPVHNIHRIRGELEPQAAAEAYTAELGAFLGAQWPTLDLILLGIGNDGHTASLFPNSDALRETAQPAVAVTSHYQGRPAQRVTLTLPIINAARQVLFLVTGADKAKILQAVLESPDAGYPAGKIRPTAGQLTWLVDVAAAGQLKHP
jgi:6-phosphogluconolactonase